MWLAFLELKRSEKGNRKHDLMDCFGVKPPRIKNPRSLVLGDDRDEKRVRLLAETKKKVYERAKKRCQCCGRPLKINQGQFHHLHKPNLRSRPSTIQFLCPTCHNNYGHEWKTRTVSTLLGGTKKVTYMKRKRVRKHPASPYWKIRRKRTTKKKATQRRRKKKTR